MLQVLSLEEAIQIMRRVAKNASIASKREKISVCCGRILAKDVVANADLPAFDRSAVDGFAVVSRDSFGASVAQPSLLRLVGEVKMGERAGVALTDGTCAAVWTGGELPRGADAMVMLEQAERLPGGLIAVEESAAPGRHIVFRGDDVRAGDVILFAGTRLTAREIGLLAAAGVTVVEVFTRPRVGILSTGDELIDPAQTPIAGQIRDSNGEMLLAACREAGAEARLLGRVPDEEEALRLAMKNGVEGCDLLLLSGGSSAGAKDAACRCLASLGEVLFHGLALKPGKPAFAGRIGGTIVVGLPGHPAAAYLVFHALVRQILAVFAGSEVVERMARATLQSAAPSNEGREELLPVRLCAGMAEPVALKSGLLSPLTRANGYIRIPRDAEGLPEGAPVDVILF